MGYSISKGFEKILSNTGFLVGEQVINMGLSFLVGIWVARYLGPEDLGLWQYAQSLVGLGTAVATLGASQIVVRDLVNNPEDEGRILGTTFILIICSGVATSLVIGCVGWWQNEETLVRWLVVIASVNLLFQAFNVFDFWFQSKVLSKYSAYARTMAQIIISALKVTFIILGLTLIYFALTVVVASIIRALVWIYNYNKKSILIKDWHFDASYAQQLLINAWPLILTGVSTSIYMRIDQVMLKSMAGADAVGNYAVAVMISEMWYFIPISITSSVFPAIVNSSRDSESKYNNRLQLLYDAMAGVGVLIAIPITLLGDLLITILFGPEFNLASKVLVVYVWSAVFVFLGVARSSWLINENFQKFGMVFMVIGACSNIVLNVWLIPNYGIVGAAWATIFSQGLSSWFLTIIFAKTRIVFYMHTKSLVKALLIIPSFATFRQILTEAGVSND